MSHDTKKNILKLEITTYLEESLSMVGRMMIDDIYNTIDSISEDEAKEVINEHLDQNIFELIAPYVQRASEEYEAYKRTPEGKTALTELRQVVDEVNEKVEQYIEQNTTKKEGTGNGNVH